jgi:hypothetical protein
MRKEKTSSRIMRQTVRSSDMSKNDCQDTVEGSAPFKTKKEATSSLRAGDVGAPATLGSCVLTDRKKE